MDRQIVYPGSIPLDTDLLNVQRNTMLAVGYLAQAALGIGTVVDGLACAPTVPASMSVTVGPGSITQFGVVDALAYGSLPADSADPLLKMGINIAPTSFPLTAPTTSGQSANYLIQASLLEGDLDPVVLPYYNAANPAQPYSGPDNSGVAQNTQRVQRVQLQLKPGAAAATGSQATPPVDNGWVGLYVVTVSYGDTQVTEAAIATLPTAPFLPFTLPQLAPGFSRQQLFNTTTTWAVPAGVTRLKVRLVGGGAGGGGATATQAAGGGGAGGYAEGVFAVTPGQQVAVTVGSGGAGGAVGGNNGGNGGTTSFGGMISATGGRGGTFSISSPGGGGPGTGSGGAINLQGGFGTDGSPNATEFGGDGGSSAFGGGGRAAQGGGLPANGTAPGSGGGGAYGNAAAGGTGAPGLVIVEY